MKFNALLALAALMSLGILAGCQNTAEGMKEDAQKNEANMKEDSADMGEKIREGAEDAAATGLTGLIKSAIIANPRLNNPANKIDVNSTAEHVELVGHVTTEDLKKTAGEIAATILKEQGAKQPLHNKLEVKS